MDWNFKFDDEMGEIIFFYGLFNLFAFQFQHSSVFLKNNQHIACIRHTIKLLKIRAPEKFAVVTLKLNKEALP